MPHGAGRLETCGGAHTGSREQATGGGVTLDRGGKRHDVLPVETGGYAISVEAAQPVIAADAKELRH